MRFVLSFLIFGNAFFSSLSWANPLHVLIDPGHGGNDGGAVHGKAKESEIALSVGFALKELLSADPLFHASMTRVTDRYLTLQERVSIAEKTKTDLLISIHANASNDRRARGVEVYFQNHLPPDEETLFLASNENRFSHAQAGTAPLESVEPTKKNDVLSILDDLKRQHRLISSHKLSQKLLREWDVTGPSGSGSNAIRQAPFYVVSKTNVPSVLVELGFLTNPKEANRLMSPAYQKEIAQKIYKGLVSFRQSKEKMQEKMASLDTNTKNQ